MHRVAIRAGLVSLAPALISERGSNNRERDHPLEPRELATDQRARRQGQINAT